VSPNGVKWEDISANSETNLCIKAFTTSNELPEADFSSNVTSGIYPLTVQFTDLSSNALSWKWDMNGDGNTDSIAQNPVYTYGSYGNYVVSLTIGNSKGFDTETKPGYIRVAPLSINSASPRGNITSYKGEKQEFSVSTNYVCNVSWYFNGESRDSKSSVKNSSYSEIIHSPGFYNVTAIARTGDEKVTQSWKWTVRDWNQWDSPASQEGKNISTEELQEAIHIYRNGLQIPETGAELTNERLKELILLWREGSGQ
jgi:PKD repeat protein